MERQDIVRIADAPNWAETRFALSQNEFELRVLRDVLGCENIGISYLRFGPGWRMTRGHRHPAGEEVYVLVEGRARIKVDDEILELTAPSAIRVPGRRWRAIRAEGDEAAVFVVASYPIDDPDATEFERDFWPTDNAPGGQQKGQTPNGV